MTEVAFHVNVPDVLAYACRLLRKAYVQGARVSVMVDEAQIEALDRDLWLLAQAEFVPHATQQSAPHVRQHSPVLLCSGQPEAAQVLVNLSSQMPAEAGAFGRVIEIVGNGDDVRLLARERWRLYRDGGLNPVAIDRAADKVAPPS